MRAYIFTDLHSQSVSGGGNVDSSVDISSAYAKTDGASMQGHKNSIPNSSQQLLAAGRLQCEADLSSGE